MVRPLESPVVRRAFWLAFTLLVIAGAGIDFYNEFLDVAPVFEHRWLKGPYEARYSREGDLLIGPLKDKFRAGDTMIYMRDVCVMRHKPGRIDRQIVNIETGRIWPYVSTTWTADKTTCSPPPLVKTIELPSDLIPGHYEMRFHINIKVNDYRAFDQDMPALAFEITP